MQAVSAWERLSMSRAMSLGMATGDAARHAREDEVRVAYPPDAEGFLG